MFEKDTRKRVKGDRRISMNHFDTQMSDQPLLVHRFPAQAKNLKDIRAKVRGTLMERGFGTDIIEHIVIAIDEACQNIIRHAYGKETEEKIVLHIHYHPQALEITLRDYAPHVTMNCIQPRDLKDVRPGGLGGHFIHQTMNEITLEHAPDGNGNILRMMKQFA
ncbi:MAG: hypothetical protein NPIRA05_07370 [Nitrospirales bacterium]|nr:MAG: hypothetical protein NPIRA05_07370 [Nitrospirales bacterium]